MKNKPITKFMQGAAPLLVLLSILNPQPSTVHAQGTAFTYQGRLNSGTSPASGSYDLTFTLFATNITGVVIAGPATNAATAVTNGLFTVTLDFGSGLFTGSTNRWLEIGVRTNGAGSFTTLTPRQQLTPTPYAIFAGSASNLSGVLPAGQLSGTIPNGNLPANPNFSGLVTANSLAGNGANVTNVNAATLNGLAAGNFWQTGGNSGTTAGANYLGTADNQPLEAHVNGLRALRLEPVTGDSPNVIGGSPVNVVDAGVQGAVIAGGGTTNFAGQYSSNRISANFCSIGGGSGNWIQSGADHSVIGGGWTNLISAGAYESVIAGGVGNVIYSPGQYDVIGGGYQNGSGGQYATVGGGAVNRATGIEATVAGGDYNSATGDNSVVGGGNVNISSGIEATVAGGSGNLASGPGAFVGGGGYFNAICNSNIASGFLAAVVGGSANVATNDFASVGGGYTNTASGAYSTVPGGRRNTAGGDYSFAAGYFAQAINNGTFIWADSQGVPFSSTATNQFLIRAQGGVGINTNNPGGASFYALGSRTNGWQNSVGYFENASAATNASPAMRVLADGGGRTPDGALSVSANVLPTTPNSIIAEFGNANAFVVTITNDGTIYSKGVALTSDRNAKENFTALNAATVLAKVVAMPVTEWNYKEDGAPKRHIGPMAQDFHEAFGLNGRDDTHISVVDEGGVALAAIQGLNWKLKEKDAEIQKLKEKAGKVDSLEKRLNELEQMVQFLAAKK